MLRSYFETDEIIYLFRSSNGKRFSMKDIMMFIFGFIFGIFTIISIILSFFFTIKLLLAAVFISMLYSEKYLSIFSIKPNISLSIRYSTVYRTPIPSIAIGSQTTLLTSGILQFFQHCRFFRSYFP